MKSILFCVLTLNLMACSSYFKRQDCEATNWFAYGEKVALEGRRLSGDSFISECYIAEADVAESALDRGFKSGLEKYCQPAVVFQNGKSGNFFSTEMCTGQGLANLMAQHRAGIAEYCLKSNAYSVGAKGEVYNKVCPADLEAAFLPEFNRGRKRFLETNIAENEKAINRLEHEISSLQSELRFKTSEWQRYQYITSKDEKFIQNLNEINRERLQLESSVRNKQNEQSRMQNKNREIKLELIKLE